MGTERLRILHLIDSYRIGGPGKTIINSAKFIDRARFVIHVAYFAPADESRDEFGRAVEEAGIPYYGLAERGRLDLSQVGKLRELLVRQKVDILHTHGYKPDILGVLVRRSLPGLSLLTTHHGWIENSLPQKVFSRIARRLTRKFDGVVCVAKHLMEQLPPDVVESRRSRVIHNALVLDDYRPSGSRTAIRQGIGVQESSFLVGVIGRLSLEKGCSEALEAFRLLRDDVKDVRLVLLGEGPLEVVLRERTKTLGLENVVHFAGHQSPVQPWMEALDLLWSPSRSEGLSNVLLEALAFHLPVVATRVGGNAEIITDGISGFLVEPEDPRAFAGATRALVRDRSLGEKLAIEGHRTIIERFGFEERMRRMEAFYDEVLGRGRSGGS